MPDRVMSNICEPLIRRFGATVAKLARRLILGQTTLGAEFPAYRYDKADWLREQAIGEATE